METELCIIFQMTKNSFGEIKKNKKKRQTLKYINSKY